MIFGAISQIAISIGGCGNAATPPNASIARIEKLTGSPAFPARKIAAARIGPGGNVYLLDIELGALVRSTDTGVVAVTPIGLIQNPTDFQWIGDTLVILDGTSDRALIFNLAGKPVRVLQLPHPFGNDVFDSKEMRVYLSVYAARYYYTANRFIPASDSLVEEVSLADGKILGSFGSPAQYGHARLQFRGNDVMLAVEPTTSSIAFASPISPHVRIRGIGRHLSYDLPYTASFKPPQPRVVQLAPAPMPPDVDYQRVVYSIDVDSAGQIFILAASSKQTVPVRAASYSVPHQIVDILNGTGRTICRITLPFFATSVVVAQRDELLLADSAHGNGASRISYHCPAEEGTRHIN